MCYRSVLTDSSDRKIEQRAERVAEAASRQGRVRGLDCERLQPRDLIRESSVAYIGWFNWEVQLVQRPHVINVSETVTLLLYSCLVCVDSARKDSSETDLGAVATHSHAEVGNDTQRVANR